jgi:hypothetical protein
MPRKSQYSSIKPILSGEKPAPPDHLREDMREEWKKIVAAMPVGWFKPEMLPLLEEHCRTIVFLHEVTAELDKVDLVKLDQPAEKKLYARYLRLTSLMLSLTHKLRLNARCLTTTDRAPGAVAPPWSN